MCIYACYIDNNSEFITFTVEIFTESIVILTPYFYIMSALYTIHFQACYGAQ